VYPIMYNYLYMRRFKNCRC